MSDFIFAKGTAVLLFIVQQRLELRCIKAWRCHFPHSRYCYSLCPKLELNPTFDAGPNCFSLAVTELQLSLVSLSGTVCHFIGSYFVCSIPPTPCIKLLFFSPSLPVKDSCVFLSLFDNRSGISHSIFNAYWSLKILTGSKINLLQWSGWTHQVSGVKLTSEKKQRMPVAL